MTLDDLKHQNKSFIDFWRFWAATRISRVNCAEITKNKLGQPAIQNFQH